eukprot:1156128-Prymnesium_polylepis.2
MSRNSHAASQSPDGNGQLIRVGTLPCLRPRLWPLGRMICSPLFTAPRASRRSRAGRCCSGKGERALFLRQLNYSTAVTRADENPPDSVRSEAQPTYSVSSLPSRTTVNFEFNGVNISKFHGIGNLFICARSGQRSERWILRAEKR